MYIYILIWVIEFSWEGNHLKPSKSKLLMILYISTYLLSMK